MHPAKPPLDGGDPLACSGDPQPWGPCPARRRAGAALGGAGGLTPLRPTHRKSVGRMHSPRCGVAAGSFPLAWGGWAGAAAAEET